MIARDKILVLVVDDYPSVQAVLTDILSAEGFQVQSVDSGDQALGSIAAKQPQLILLDIMMPGLDGFEVCRRLKSQEKTRNIPVIFLSGITDVDAKEKGFDLGAVDFISKPFKRKELLTRVRSHLELTRMRNVLEAQVVERTAQLRILAEEVEDLYENAPCGYHILDVDKKDPEKCKLFETPKCPHYDNESFIGIKGLAGNAGHQGKHTTNYENYVEAQKICSECPKWVSHVILL